MNETRTLSQPTYDRAVAMLGLDHVDRADHRARLLYDGRDHAQRLRRAGAGRRTAVAVNAGYREVDRQSPQAPIPVADLQWRYADEMQIGGYPGSSSRIPCPAGLRPSTALLLTALAPPEARRATARPWQRGSPGRRRHRAQAVPGGLGTARNSPRVRRRRAMCGLPPNIPPGLVDRPASPGTIRRNDPLDQRLWTVLRTSDRNPSMRRGQRRQGLAAEDEGRQASPGDCESEPRAPAGREAVLSRPRS